MKLELKHLAPYLPYGLKGLRSHDHLNKKCVVELYGSDEYYLNISNPFGGHDYKSIKEFKPILRQLSDLTKEIEHNGEKFVPIKELGINKNWLGINDYHIHVYNQPYSEVQKLLEWHFDIFGLIENGLAIDINTLNNEKRNII